MKERIGIYAGAFDPVHAGHIAFALQALQTAQLDAVYFVPERRPRHKSGVEHFGHRMGMLRQAIRPHPSFYVLDLTDISFSIEYTLPKLERQFPDAELVFIIGSDVLDHLGSWPKAYRLLKRSELVVGIRDRHDARAVNKRVRELPCQPKALTVVQSHRATVSSGKVRAALRSRTTVEGVLASVQRYSLQHWLYVSLA